jgi:hypothetical protein
MSIRLGLASMQLHCSTPGTQECGQRNLELISPSPHCLVSGSEDLRVERRGVCGAGWVHDATQIQRRLPPVLDLVRNRKGWKVKH